MDARLLNLNDLQLFARVVEHRGFAPAARALGLPKSTLSKRVAALETALGARLIQRTSRSFAVTEAGEDCYRHASAMLIEAEGAESAVKGRLAEPTGVVRITASVPTAQLMLAPLLPELALAWPKLRIMLHASDRFVDIVQEGFDIALRSHFTPLPDSELLQRRLGRDAGLLVASPSYLARAGIPVEPQELMTHEGLMTSLTETTWRLSSEAGETAEVAPHPRFHSDEAVVLLEAAAAGLGITRLPGNLCRAALARGDLVHVLPAWAAAGVTTTLLMPHRRGQLPSVRTVADFLVARLSG